MRRALLIPQLQTAIDKAILSLNDLRQEIPVAHLQSMIDEVTLSLHDLRETPVVAGEIDPDDQYDLADLAELAKKYAIEVDRVFTAIAEAAGLDKDQIRDVGTPALDGAEGNLVFLLNERSEKAEKAHWQGRYNEREHSTLNIPQQFGHRGVVV